MPEPKYRLEFVGDSITSGEGTVGAVYEEDWISAFFSAENTYPRMVADALSAEYRVISQSGWGIVTGWNGNVENKIPPFYTQVCGLLTGERNASLGALEDYDFEAWQPPTSRRESPSNYRERDRNISARTVIEEIYNFLRKM